MQWCQLMMTANISNNIICQRSCKERSSRMTLFRIMDWIKLFSCHLCCCWYYFTVFLLINHLLLDHVAFCRGYFWTLPEILAYFIAKGFVEYCQDSVLLFLAWEYCYNLPEILLNLARAIVLPCQGILLNFARVLLHFAWTIC